MVRLLLVTLILLVLVGERWTLGDDGYRVESRANDPSSSIQETNSAKLTWSSGDVIPGQWIGADRESIRWFADTLFRDPVQIDRRYLRSIDFSPKSGLEAKDEVAPGTYLIQWVDGGRMFGQIRQLDATHLTVFDPRYGEVKLRREHVSGLQNLANAGQWTAGRFDLNQWDAARGQKRYWQVNSQGALRSNRQNIHLYREAELPASSLIEIELSWTKKLDFLFGLGVPRNARETDQLPRLETWDDSLVFSYGDNFEIVMESFTNPQNRLRLLVHWDQVNKKVAIHDATGKLLCSADLSELAAKNKPGIYLENKVGDLTLNELRIRQSQPGFDSTRPSFQLSNKPAVNGQIQAFDGTNWTIETSAATENTQQVVVSVPHAEFSNAFSINPAIPVDGSVVTQIEYSDGTLLAGELQDFDGQRIKLASNAVDQPMELQIAGARLIKFPIVPPPPNDQEFTHQMFNLVGSMRGRLEPGSQIDGNVLQWRLPGASESVAFASAHAKVILQKRKRVAEATERWRDTLYFYNKDRIPCRVLNIKDKMVQFESFTELSQVDSSLLKAIDLESAMADAAVTPQDANWIIPETARPMVVVKENEFEISDAASFSHANLMRTGGFEFQMKWKPGGYGTLELDLFGAPRLDRAGRAKLLFYFYDSNVMVSSDGQGGLHTHATNKNQARVRIQLEDKEIHVAINNQHVAAQPLPHETLSGTGVKFTFANVTNGKFSGRMSDVQYLIAQERGETTVVADEQKELLLTIPRIRKNNPPQHILRAANGDMVRGELVSLDQEAIQFRVNHEALRFPRRLVSSLIWLHFQATESSGDDDTTDNDDSAVSVSSPQSETPPANESEQGAATLRQTVQVLISGDRRLTYDLHAWRDEQLVGRSSALGECAIPLAQIEELRFGSFANEALDVPYSDWVARLAPEPKLMTGAEGDQRSDMLFGTRSPLIGTELPDLKLTTLEGDTIELKSLVGKVVVLDFWATWCSPCIRAMPDLIAATGEFPSEDVVLFAVNQEEDPATIREFLAGRGWQLQVGLDNGTLSRRLQVQSLPQTIIIGPDGKIAFVKVGYSSDLRESLKRAISSFLAE